MPPKRHGRKVSRHDTFSRLLVAARGSPAPTQPNSRSGKAAVRKGLPLPSLTAATPEVVPRRTLAADPRAGDQHPNNGELLSPRRGLWPSQSETSHNQKWPERRYLCSQMPPLGWILPFLNGPAGPQLPGALASSQQRREISPTQSALACTDPSPLGHPPPTIDRFHRR